MTQAFTHFCRRLHSRGLTLAEAGAQTVAEAVLASHSALKQPSSLSKVPWTSWTCMTCFLIEESEGFCLVQCLKYEPIFGGSLLLS